MYIYTKKYNHRDRNFVKFVLFSAHSSFNYSLVMIYTNTNTNTLDQKRINRGSRCVDGSQQAAQLRLKGGGGSDFRSNIQMSDNIQQPSFFNLQAFTFVKDALPSNNTGVVMGRPPQYHSHHWPYIS